MLAAKPLLSLIVIAPAASMSALWLQGWLPERGCTCALGRRKFSIIMSQDRSQYLHQFVLHAALDAVEEHLWSSPAMHLGVVDRFNNLQVHAQMFTQIFARNFAKHTRRQPALEDDCCQLKVLSKDLVPGGRHHL